MTRRSMFGISQAFGIASIISVALAGVCGFIAPDVPNGALGTFLLGGLGCFVINMLLFAAAMDRR